MTTIGTSIAAAVAGTSLQAQQVARQRDRGHAQSAQDAQRLHELIQEHVEALEEGTEVNSADQLRITGQLPQHQSPEQEPQHDPRRKPKPEAGDASSEPSPEQPVAPDTDPSGNLYRHLDVRA